MRTITESVDKGGRKGRPRSLGGGKALAVVCAAMFVSYLPFSATNGALGQIAAATGATTSDLQWANDAFVLALASVVLAAGALGDLYGRRRIAEIGLLWTTVGVLLTGCGAVLPNSATLIAMWVGQAVAGVGAGLVMTATLALISASTHDQAERSRGIALWASANVMGLTVGPFISGAVTAFTGAIGWHWIFPPIAVVSAFTLVWLHTVAPESSAPEGRSMDWAGTTLGLLAVAGIVFGIITGGSDGWGTPLSTVALFGGVLLLALFVAVELRSTSPSLQLDLFRSPSFTAASIAGAAVLFTIGGMAFVLSLFFGRGQHLSALDVAVRLACMFALNAVAGPVAARMQRSYQARVPLLSGLVIGVVGLATLGGAAASSSLFDMGWRLAIIGFGCGLVMSTASTVAVSSVDVPLRGMAGAANNTVRQIGAVLGRLCSAALLLLNLRAVPASQMPCTLPR